MQNGKNAINSGYIRQQLSDSTSLSRDDIELFIKVLEYSEEKYVSHFPQLQNKLKKTRLLITELLNNKQYDEIEKQVMLFNSLENPDIDIISPPVPFNDRELSAVQTLEATKTIWRSKKDIRYSMPHINVLSKLLIKRGIKNEISELLKSGKIHRNRMMKLFGIYFSIDRSDWITGIYSATVQDDNCKEVIFNSSTPGILHPIEYKDEESDPEKKLYKKIHKGVWNHLINKDITVRYYWDYDGLKNYLKDEILPDYKSGDNFDYERLKTDIRSQLERYLKAKNISIILLRFPADVYNSKRGGIANIYRDGFDITFRFGQKTKCAITMNKKYWGKELWEEIKHFLPHGIDSITPSIGLSYLLKIVPNPFSWIYLIQKLSINDFNSTILKRMSRDYYPLKNLSDEVSVDEFVDDLFQILNL